MEKHKGAPRKTDGSKKVQVVISVRQDRIDKLTKEGVKESAHLGIELEYKKPKVAKNQTNIIDQSNELLS